MNEKLIKIYDNKVFHVNGDNSLKFEILFFNATHFHLFDINNNVLMGRHYHISDLCENFEDGNWIDDLQYARKKKIEKINLSIKKKRKII